MMVAVIDEWKSHLYWYVPGVVNVNVKVAEFDSVPESKESGPLVLVAVWENESKFVQVMLSPT